jgi:hypothetical protein
VCQAKLLRSSSSASAEPKLGLAAAIGQDFDIKPTHPGHACPESFGHGLFGGPPCGQFGRSPAEECDLSRRINAVEEALAPSVQRFLNTVNLNYINAAF